MATQRVRAPLHDVGLRGTGLFESYRAVLVYGQSPAAWQLLDEVHEALDHEYREVVEKRAKELLTGGGIVVAAGHDHPLLERICTRALWMDGGHVVGDGPFAELQARYLSDGSPAEMRAVGR